MTTPSPGEPGAKPGQAQQPAGPPRALMLGLRYGLPVLLALFGVALIVAGDGRKPVAGAGVVIIGVALMIWMLNWMVRMSLESNRDRDREEQARDYYAAHGHWPGEDER